MNSTSDCTENAHAFRAFVRDFYRDSGREEPVFEFDPRTPIAFEACVDEVKFSVGYDPLSAPACLFAYCVFGVLTPTTEAATLRRLLALNISMAQQHGAVYCIDDSTAELACYLRTTMDTDVRALKADLAQIAQRALQWRRDGFTGKVQRLVPLRMAGERPVWMEFA